MMGVTENRVPLINLFNHISIQAVFLLGQEKRQDLRSSINNAARLCAFQSAVKKLLLSVSIWC